MNIEQKARELLESLEDLHRAIGQTLAVLPEGVSAA